MGAIESFIKKAEDAGQPKEIIDEVIEEWYKTKSSKKILNNNLSTQNLGIKFFALGYSSAKIRDCDELQKIMKQKKVKGWKM